MYLEDIKITMILDQMRGLSVFLELLSFLNIRLNRSGAPWECLWKMCDKPKTEQIMNKNN